MIMKCGNGMGMLTSGTCSHKIALFARNANITSEGRLRPVVPLVRPSRSHRLRQAHQALPQKHQIHFACASTSLKTLRLRLCLHLSMVLRRCHRCRPPLRSRRAHRVGLRRSIIQRRRRMGIRRWRGGDHEVGKIMKLSMVARCSVEWIVYGAWAIGMGK
jgi:hypothetical protein